MLDHISPDEAIAAYRQVSRRRVNRKVELALGHEPERPTLADVRYQAIAEWRDSRPTRRLDDDLADLERLAEFTLEGIER